MPPVLLSNAGPWVVASRHSRLRFQRGLHASGFSRGESERSRTPLGDHGSSEPTFRAPLRAPGAVATGARIFGGAGRDAPARAARHAALGSSKRGARTCG